MALLDWLRKKPLLSDRAALVDWLDTRAAFLIQKGIHEYSRARAGLQWQAIYQEKMFIEALDIARWRSYPIGLALVSEVVDGILRPYATNAPALAGALAVCALEAFDRHPVFPAIGEAEWREMRAELRGKVIAASLHPPKAVKDIPTPVQDRIFDLMPMHARIKQQDNLIVHNHLKTSLIAMSERFPAEFDLPAVARAIAA